MLVPLLAHQAVFSGAKRVFARLWKLGRLLSILGHWHRVTLPRTLEVLQMPQELVLFQGFFVGAVGVFAKAWIERLVVPFELIARADAVLFEIALMVVVDSLTEQLIAHGTVWVGASSRVDRLPIFALLDERLLRTALLLCQLLLQADAVLLEGFPVILGHVLRQRLA